jgi:LmbE family N-acetylglucosaminyl deacetylase
MVGLAATDAVYPFARDHLHFPEHAREGLEPHKVRQLWYWGADTPNVIVDVTKGVDKQVAAVMRHESQVGGLNVAPGETIGDRIRKGAAACAEGYPFAYGAQFRRLIARS